MITWYSHGILDFGGCHNNSPHIWWLETTGICSPTGLETRGPKSSLLATPGSPKGLREEWFLPSFNHFFALVVVTSHPWLIPASLQSLPLSSHGHRPSWCVCVFVSESSSPFSYKWRHQPVDLGSTLIQDDSHLNQIIFAMTFFPSKATVWVSRQTWALGGTLFVPCRWKSVVPRSTDSGVRLSGTLISDPPLAHCVT